MAIDFAFPSSLPGTLDGLYLLKLLLGFLEISLIRASARDEEASHQDEQETHYFLKADALEKLIEGQLHSDVEITELTETRGNFIEAHFVDDGFDLSGVMSE